MIPSGYWWHPYLITFQRDKEWQGINTGAMVGCISSIIWHTWLIWLPLLPNLPNKLVIDGKIRNVGPLELKEPIWTDEVVHQVDTPTEAHLIKGEELHSTHVEVEGAERKRALHSDHLKPSRQFNVWPSTLTKLGKPWKGSHSWTTCIRCDLAWGKRLTHTHNWTNRIRNSAACFNMFRQSTRDHVD